MADSIDKLRDGQPDGINNTSNLKDWADYAKGNSFNQRQSKAQSKHDLGASNTKGGESAKLRAYEIHLVRQNLHRLRRHQAQVRCSNSISSPRPATPMPTAIGDYGLRFSLKR